MIQYVRKGSFMFSFDLRHGYHHLDLFEGHQMYTGFSFLVGGRVRYFFFTVLCFGLTSGPYIFTKLLRPLVRHWRGHGIQIAVFLDDGAGTNTDFDTCFSQAKQVRSDLISAGFVIHEEKSKWVPCQGLVWLGLYWNLADGSLEIPEKRLEKVTTQISHIWCRIYGVSARTIANLAGLIISLSPSLGAITQLMTRYMHFAINSRLDWDSPLNLSECTGLHQELHFWFSNVKQLNGRCKFDQQCRIYPLTIYSDSSSVACAAFIENKHQMVCHQMFSDDEKLQSSTYRELLGIKLAVKSFGPVLKNQEVQFCSDSQNALRILEKGSRKSYLHELAMAVFATCIKCNLKLQLHWVPRSENQKSDYLSRLIDTDDWQITEAFFQYVNSLWEPVDIDQFASYKNKKVARFNSRYWNPGTEAVNCYSADWSHDMNLLVPPLNQVSRCVRYLLECKAKGVLMCPAWKSASFWPLLFSDKVNAVTAAVTDFRIVTNNGNIFIAGSCRNDMFWSQKVHSVLVARLDGCV